MDHWTEVSPLGDLSEERGQRVVVNGRPVALFLDGGVVYALEDRCPHRDGQLSRGRV
jgi:nitrite reductase/ring-hydroxylating ferredoxin subunit